MLKVYTTGVMSLDDEEIWGVEEAKVCLFSRDIEQQLEESIKLTPSR